LSLRYVRDHKIMSVVAVIVVAAIVVVATRAISGSSGGGVPSATCSTAISDLSGVSVDLENGNDAAVYTASNNAYIAVYDASGYGSKLVKDLSSLESDANVLSSGTTDNTASVTADLQTVYGDCGKSYRGN
jgi:FlaG/FlaF family flagellin (archaellin)